VPGSEIYHDACYWVPLMLVLYGGRSSELVGLPLTDVFENEPIPYFRIEYSDLRALKNLQSVRSLPIHPELIRLGFIDYVRAMRGAGHALLFPEMYSPGSSSFASTFYKAVFKRWREWAFPEGTSWRHQQKGMIKDKDVHSFRGTAASLLKGRVPDSVRIDILGHEGDNETTRTYDEEADMASKLEALALLSPLTVHLTPVPLRLRPLRRQKFGGQRGRPGK
jgi:integrase